MSYHRDLWVPQPLNPKQRWGKSFLLPRQRGLGEPCGRRTGLLLAWVRSLRGLALPSTALGVLRTPPWQGLGAEHRNPICASAGGWPPAS